MISPTLSTLYRFELRTLLRDRRTIFASIVLPILVMPLLLFSSGTVERAREQRQEARVYYYAVNGPEQALVRQLIADYRADAPADSGTRLTLEEVDAADPQAQVEAQEIHFIIEGLPPGTPLSEDGEPEVGAADDDTRDDGAGTEVASAQSEGAADDTVLPLLRLVYRANWEASETASDEMRRRLAEVRRDQRHFALVERGFPVTADQVAVVGTHDVATAEQLTGATLGRYATVFILLFLLTGGSVVAADAIAGEKERGTLETVLTTAANRREIVAAKLSVIVTVGVVITIIQLLNLLLYVGLELIEVPETFAVDLSIGTVVLLLLLFLPLAALAGCILLLVSGYAKTYKEFQLYFFPVFLLLLVPALASMLPGVQLRSAIALVPIANLSVAVREVLVGHFDGLFLAITWLVSLAATAFAGRATLQALSTERLITASEIDRAEFEGGAALLPRHVWRWYGAMWVALMLVAGNFEAMRTLRAQIVFNLIVLFLGGSLLIVWRYRLPVKEALALRPVRPVVWLAVVLGAPALHLSALAAGKLSAYLFPIPKSLLEGATESLLPSGMPLWELLFLVAILPGICEEIAFRGVLLHALRRSFHPIALCLVTGLVFGLFHISLIRLLPTAALGVLLAAVTLLTGSIFPAMLWHALNNAMA
ncbi:MAG: CPBP family glutamic-type intramembrane protease, partial [Acidobacteriota bacterium]